MSDQTIRDPAISTPPSGVESRSFFKLLPAIVIVGLLGLARVWIFIGEPSIGVIMFSLMIAPLLGFVAMLVWWWFFSGFRLLDRQLALGVLASDVVLILFVAHPTFRGIGVIPLVIPVALACWVGWLLVSLFLPAGVRLVGVLIIFLAAGGVSCAARMDGIRGSFNGDYSWRWSPTAEDRMLAKLNASPHHSKNEKASNIPGGIPAGADLSLQPGDWPAFRGPMRDGRLTGVRIKTNWDQSPPKELWRHLIGPGWSSFAVVGDHVFTQEQRGKDEYAVCYDANTGKEIWSHYNPERFEETMAGPGPRATPTFDAGRLYVLGAKGTLDCLQAATGKLIWSHNIITDTDAKLPMWGFASSPLVSHGLVSVYAGGPNSKAVVAYRADTGELAWTAGDGLFSYSSPQLVTIDGVEQILMSTNLGLSSIEPSAGKLLWTYDWSVGNIARIVQPTIVGDHDLLLGCGMGVGTRRISVSRQGDAWQQAKAWETKKIKPYYNDLVVAGDYIYGFDGSAFLCMSLKDQTNKWRIGDYGAGQVLLLADQNLLLVLAETGEVALLKAQPERREEVGKFKALEGKTWNHPVIAHGKLFVRNGEEVACFALPTE